MTKRIRPWVFVIVLLLVAALGWYLRELPLWAALRALLSDEAALQAAVDRLGWLGPLALIGFNALQIVVAPIPGYVVQLAAGFLYGPFWGGLWATIGLFVGSLSAMWLGRRLGRPLVERMVGTGQLQRWESVIHSENIYIWFILLLGPTGDAPYYLAGLARVRFIHIALITLCIRVPSVFVAAAVGAGVVTLTWWQLSLMLAVVGGVAAYAIRHQERFAAYMDRWLETLSNATKRRTGPLPEPPPQPMTE